MNFKEIRKLIEEDGKIIVVENDEPVLVVLTYEQYKNRKKEVIQPKSEEIVATPVQERVQSPVQVQQMPPRHDGELTIDDLPL